MDVANKEAMATLCRGIFDRWGKLDLWMHTAIHASPLAPASMIDAKEFNKAVAINLTAAGPLITYVAPLLGTNGHAVFFDDGRAGEKFFGTYGASKSAQIALARSWQAETRKTGPHVHLVTPPAMPTALRARFFPGENRASLTDIHSAAAQVLSQLPV